MTTLIKQKSSFEGTKYQFNQPQQVATLLQVTKAEYIPAESFRAMYQRIDAVCRIILPNASNGEPRHGTGFLIDNGLLMTNNHVLPDEDTAKQSKAQFLYEEENPDQAFPVDFAPGLFFYTSKTTNENGRVPLTAEELDFTIIALQPDSRLARSQKYSFSLFGSANLMLNISANIIQHPSEQLQTVQEEGRSFKRIAFRDNFVTLVEDEEDNFTFHYTTITRKGSSGSPVMDDHAKLFGLHRASCRYDLKPYEEDYDEQTSKEHKDCNVAVKISKIVEHLRIFKRSGKTISVFEELRSFLPPVSVELTGLYKIKFQKGLQSEKQVDELCKQIEEGKTNISIVDKLRDAKRWFEQAKEQAKGNEQKINEANNKAKLMHWRWLKALYNRSFSFLKTEEELDSFQQIEMVIDDNGSYDQKQNMLKELVAEYEKKDEGILKFASLGFLYEALDRPQEATKAYFNLSSALKNTNSNIELVTRASNLALQLETSEQKRHKGELMHLAYEKTLQLMLQSKKEKVPFTTCFIMYDGSKEVGDWIENYLYRDLINLGLVPIFQPVHFRPNDNIVDFQRNVRDAHWAIIVNTPDLKKRFDEWNKEQVISDSIGVMLEYLKDRLLKRVSLETIFHLHRSGNWDEIKLDSNIETRTTRTAFDQTKTSIDVKSNQAPYHSEVSYFLNSIDVFGKILNLSPEITHLFYKQLNQSFIDITSSYVEKKKVLN